jgi:hypothetical protein
MAPVINQTLWGPIDKLPGTAVNPYLMPPSPGTQTVAQSYYWDLTEAGKGKDADNAILSPTYDSIKLYKSGFVRFVNDAGNLKAFVSPVTINSTGQTVAAGPDVLVGMRLYDGHLEGQYRKVWVLKDDAGDTEWLPLLPTRPSSPVTCM